MVERFQYFMLEVPLDIEFQVDYEDGERTVHVSSVSVWGSSLHMDRIPPSIMREIEDACLRVHDKKRYMQPNAKEIDLRKIKLPWGTFSEVARRMGVQRNTVRDGWRRQSPKYVDAVLEYLENRKETNRQIIARALRATDKK